MAPRGSESVSEKAMRTFKLLLAFDGSDFAGWQIQPGLRTVQGVIQDLFSRVTGSSVIIVGSSRTDSGVHALGQVAVARDVDWKVDAKALSRAVTMRLPADISLLACEEVSEDFHPIRQALCKRYEYRLRFGGLLDPFVHRYAWHVPYRLNVEAMQLAAQHLLGQHDFRSFQASGADRRSTIRHVTRLELQPIQHGVHGLEVVLGIEANGFLYNMVRNIVGTLVEVGRGKESPDWVLSVLHQRDRSYAGPTAPARGLYLVRVDFPRAEQMVEAVTA
jgi:tRNA pseudouridine38-40 synthase